MATLFVERFNDPAVNAEDLPARLAWLRDVVGPRLERFLGYYRNPTTELAAALPCAPTAAFAVKPFRQFQEIGLPARITGFRQAADGNCVAAGSMDAQRKEVVIENDIGWRIDTLVDFAAAREPGITSTAADPALRQRLNGIITGILEATCAGGCLPLLQSLVLQGCINGSAWVQIRPSAELLARLAGGGGGAAADDAEVMRWLQLEVLGARQVAAVGTCVAILRENAATTPAAPAGLFGRLRAWISSGAAVRAEEFSFDIIGPALWQRYEAGVLAQEAENLLGFVPFVRFENAPDPAAGTRVGPAGSAAVDAGFGDVEPLIGLQDELNTRLSDRAFRVTMASFRMYLGKGIEDFIKRPIGPGQMWGTDNMDATIESFGGDQRTPSEDSHIGEVRDALDKISGVSAVAAGLIRGKLGNLTSAIALRLTLIALLARTERKRVALTQAMEAIVRMSLAMLDKAGVVRTAPEDREIDVNWPTALPESDMDRLTEAQAKLAIGVPRAVVLTELGYGELVQAPAGAAPTKEAPASSGQAEASPGGDSKTTSAAAAASEGDGIATPAAAA